MMDFNFVSKIISEFPNLKDNSIKQYSRCLTKLVNNYELFSNLEKDDEYYVEKVDNLFDNPDTVDKCLIDTRNKRETWKAFSPTTSRNYYTAIATILKCEDVPNKKLIREYENKVKNFNLDYIEQNQKDNIISEKQNPNFIEIEKVDELISKLKKDNLQGYILFKFLKLYPLRNEIATLIKIPLKQYNKLSNEEKEGNNYLVVGSKKMIVSRSDYKTSKKYGEIKFEIEDKVFKKELLIFVKDIPDLEYIFNFPSDKTEDKKNQLSNYLSYLSQKYIGVKISTTLMWKIVSSSKYSQSVKELKVSSAIRGQDPGTALKIYIKEPLTNT
jgi:hypothetical protein